MIWLLYTVLVRVHFILPARARFIAHVVCFVVFLVTPTVNHIRMLFAIRRLNSQLGDVGASLQMSVILQREKTVALDMWIVAILLLTSLVPAFLVKIIQLRYPLVYSIVSPWALTVTFMISSINPLLYLGRNRKLRKAVKSLI